MATTRLDGELLDFYDFSLDLAESRLTRNGQPVHLTPITTRILVKLLENPGGLVSKEELKKSAWNQKVVSDSTLHQKIAELRKALGDGDNGRAYIENTPARGYRFIAPVTVRPPSETGIKTETGTQPAAGPKRNVWKLVAVIAFATLALCAAAYIGAHLLDTFVAAPRIQEYRRLTNTGEPKTGPIVREGSRLYFDQGSIANHYLAYTTIGGADVIRMNPPIRWRDAHIEGLNPDTGELMLMESGNLWLWTPGRTWARELGLHGIDHAAFSSDGRTLAVYRPDPPAVELYDAGSLARLGPPRLLRPHSQLRFSIVYSPANDAIRFMDFDIVRRKSSIWQATLQERGLHPVFRDSTAPPNACCGAWTPDSRWFVFSSMSGEGTVNRGDLWIARELPRWISWFYRPRPRQIESPISFSWPAVGADGKTIFAIGSSRGLQAVRLDLHTREFSPYLNGTPATDLSPSRDGNWIAYTDDWQHTIWTSKSDGSNRAELTFRPMEAYQPHWSPDGERIAFMGRLPGRDWRAYVVPTFGGQPETVHEDNNEQGVPTWSADGRDLIFGDRRDQRPANKMTIHVWDFQTRQLSVLPQSAGRWSPRWSPDGRYIAAQTVDWKHLDLFDTRRQTWERIGTYQNSDDLNWSPDSAYLYFMAIPPRGHGRICYRIRLSDRKLEEILQSDEHPEFDGHIAGIAPDGSPVFGRVVSNEEIYALDVKWP